MSDTNKEQPVAESPLARAWQWIVDKRSVSRVLVPVYTREAYQQQRSFMPSPSWWTTFSGWLRYHSIQVRWDIERRLARLLGRRWVG